MAFLGSCRPIGGDTPDKEFQYEQAKPPAKTSVEAHREFLAKEQEAIKAYIAERQLDMQRNGTGIHYQIENADSFSRPVRPGDVVRYTYRISLLNGTELYRSDEQGVTLRIDREDAEIGLHDALKLMRLGESGLFILPSHRAFGVAGDQHKVPPFTALLYELEVLEIQ